MPQKFRMEWLFREGRFTDCLQLACDLQQYSGIRNEALDAAARCYLALGSPQEARDVATELVTKLNPIKL
jgi:hypothetical protein